MSEYVDIPTPEQVEELELWFKQIIECKDDYDMIWYDIYVNKNIFFLFSSLFQQVFCLFPEIPLL